jgi:hypothetical protein
MPSLAEFRRTLCTRNDSSKNKQLANALELGNTKEWLTNTGSRSKTVIALIKISIDQTIQPKVTASFSFRSRPNLPVLQS